MVKRSAKLVTFRGLYKCDVIVVRLPRRFAPRNDVGVNVPRNDVGVNAPRNDVEPEVLEQESCVDVECTVSVLLVEAACVLERYDEVLVHDEAETSTC